MSAKRRPGLTGVCIGRALSGNGTLERL
ncbi:hypothetical protein LEMLEM_LOCUS18839 [Lemmus lemmus]